ncbi:hypothetical protein L249_6850 [Ophiocordyceps polyrhachis-furcata BCC 54312]|uniref:C3H1-type domain-containing protein n=1 Tax=Ophiocordyceps polyrhachis-furcata BCC 54312 TaxID=1330021 RepID=A0A367LJB3_9HYPO|nr:hypothetical protein L249_6850 [Ophiocordyceps polyrhachis-furcata BCC 54312]
MSDEDKELLARIGQLAGQINRHKSQQATVAPGTQPAPQRLNAYRHSSAPYPRAGYRGGRPALAHRHRTLRLNDPKTRQESDAADGEVSSGGQGKWVSRTDRHRQLINADIYQKDAQNRFKAMEESRQRKIRHQRSREKRRFNDYLRRQTATAASVAESVNEIIIDGMRFRVADGGKKLLKVADDLQSAPSTPKTVDVAGVTFHRTKTGNLVASRVVRDHRYVFRPVDGVKLTAGSRSGVVKKTDQMCRIFSTTGKYLIRRSGPGRLATKRPPFLSPPSPSPPLQPIGSCPKGPRCRYIHDANKVAICREFLKEGKCGDGDSCDLSHEVSPERVPNCVHYAKGHCAKPDCPYTHSKAAPGAAVCEAFGFLGYCEKGSECRDRHVSECPDFSNTGSCKTKGCKLLHREKASVLRAHGKARGEASDDDVSSDEDSACSDDVDSDEVADFVQAETDESDADADGQDFIRV